MKIAVIGAGISGLVTAHLLAGRHEITVFEVNAYPGGHTNTVRVDTADATHWVDTGFIVFNDRNYPRFERLLERLGVRHQTSDMSFGVSDGTGDFEYCSASPNGLFAKRAHLTTPWFHRMIADLVRFNRDARQLLAGDDAGPSLGHWLDERDYSRAFVELLLVPQAAAVWSADPRQMWSFPARFLVEFFDNHGMLGFRGRPRWRTVEGGSHRYVQALTAPWRDRLRLGTPVQAVTRRVDHVEVKPHGGDAERFDEVVLAAHSDQALALLTDASDREHELLGPADIANAYSQLGHVGAQLGAGGGKLGLDRRAHAEDDCASSGAAPRWPGRAAGCARRASAPPRSRDRGRRPWRR